MARSPRPWPSVNRTEMPEDVPQALLEDLHAIYRRHPSVQTMTSAEAWQFLCDNYPETAEELAYLEES